MSVVFARSGRTVRFLGKKEVFDVPVFGQLATAMGGIRVDRGTGSDEPLEAAADALAGGEVVAIMPQGTIPRGAAFFDPELKGRLGCRPARRVDEGAGDPDRAVGHGEGVATLEPAAQRVERDEPTGGTHPRRPPVELKYRSLDADTKRIMKAISKLLPAEARKQVKPTAEELAATYPPGYKGDPEKESTRRPGHGLTP